MRPGCVPVPKRAETGTPVYPCRTRLCPGRPGCSQVIEIVEVPVVRGVSLIPLRGMYRGAPPLGLGEPLQWEAASIEAPC
jgi:hypothetical protein